VEKTLGVATLHAGSALSRLLPIGPRATLTNLRKLTLSIEASCVAPERGPQFLKRRAKEENQSELRVF